MSDRWTPTLDDFVDVAGVVLDSPEEAIRRLPRLPLAESAIAAPFASFGGVDAYPTLTEQAAVLITHLAQNHPLPDGRDVACTGFRTHQLPWLRPRGGRSVLASWWYRSAHEGEVLLPAAGAVESASIRRSTDRSSRT